MHERATRSLVGTPVLNRADRDRKAAACRTSGRRQKSGVVDPTVGSPVKCRRGAGSGLGQRTDHLLNQIQRLECTGTETVHRRQTALEVGDPVRDAGHDAGVGQTGDDGARQERGLKCGEAGVEVDASCGSQSVGTGNARRGEPQRAAVDRDDASDGETRERTDFTGHAVPARGLHVGVGASLLTLGLRAGHFARVRVVAVARRGVDRGVQRGDPVARVGDVLGQIVRDVGRAVRGGLEELRVHVRLVQDGEVRRAGALEATRKGESASDGGGRKRAPREEVAETRADTAVVALHRAARGGRKGAGGGVAVKVRVEQAENESDRHVLLDDERPDFLDDRPELGDPRSEVLSARVRDAATDEARGHRHTACEQRAGLEHEATDTQCANVADDDCVPDRGSRTGLGSDGSQRTGRPSGRREQHRAVVAGVEVRGPRRNGRALNVARSRKVVEVRDARHQELSREHQVADEHGLGRDAVVVAVGIKVSGVEIRKRDVTAAVAEYGVDGVRRGEAMRDRAHTTDTLSERDRVIDRATEQEVLEASPQVAVSIGLGDDAACVGGDFHTQVTLDT